MKWIVYILFCFAILFVLPLPFLYSQEISSDSIRSYPAAEKTEVDTTINYQANVVRTDVKSRITRLYGQAEVQYMGMHLKAGSITIDFNNNIMTAEAIPDTTQTKGTDGKENPPLTEFPVFSEAGQSMTGEKMFYNFKTKKGRVIKGRTQYEEGYYTGKDIKKVNSDVYYVKDGNFTTCDLETPHYHFSSSKMKMIYKDRVIAKPVILYIHGIPVAALPFAMFPNRRGRHSGILVPRYGQSATEGRYLRGLGYYWAPSQYWDTKLEVDFFEKTGFLFRSTTNYALRYKLHGTISGSLLRKNLEGQRLSRWDIMFSHSHIISQTMSISANGSFVSDGSYYQDFSGNREQRLRRQIRSNATLTKNWPDSKNNLSINLSRTQYLDTGSLREVFPQISFRHGQEPLINLFRSDTKNTGRTTGAATERHWYDNIYFSYNSELQNSRSQIRNNDTTAFRKDSFLGARHRISLSGAFKLFHYFNFNQGLNYNEVWQDRALDYFLDEETNRIESRDKFGFAARRTFNTSLSMNTKIYGIFPVNRWSIIGFRHIMTPSVSLGFTPDFSDPAFGYYQEVADSSGNLVKEDRFGNSIYGSTPRNAQRNLSFSLQNLFQMKRTINGEEKKYDLFTYGLSTNYNFERDSLRFSNLTSSLRASPSRIFNLTLSFSHSFYKFDPQNQRTVDKFLFSENPWHPLRLTSLSLSSSIKLDNKLFQFGGEQAKEESTASDTTESLAGENIGNRFESDESWTSKEIPWNMNLSLSYNLSKINPLHPNKQFWLNMNGNISLTENWRVGYNARFDLNEQKIVSQDFRIYRDLHCWEASFNWTPTGPYKRFYFRINIKSTLLHDIKLEKQGGRSSIFGY